MGQRRQICNIFIVWILTGLWHGAEWNFVIWGLYFAVLLSVEKTGWMKHLLEKYRIFARAYFLLLILISFVVFHAQDAGQAVSDLRGMFGAGGIAWISDEAVYYIKSYAVVLLFAAAGAVLPWNIWRNNQEAKIMCQRQAEIVPWGMQCAVGSAERWIFTVKNIYRSIEPVALLGLLVVITAYLVNGSFQAFLYFRF